MSAVDAVVAASRRISLTFYQREKDTAPHNAGHVDWSFLLRLLTMRDVRPQKSGRAYAPHRLVADGTRRSDDVLVVSMFVADFDGGAELDDVRPLLDGMAWAAYSTHNHNPDAGLVKWRLVLPLSEDVPASDWPRTWAAFNSLLGGEADRACRDAARLYYLPSCPAETKNAAFFESGEGEFWNANEVVKHYGAKQAVVDNSALRALPAPAPMPETTENIERVKSMLAVVSADCDRETWRNAVWAVLATGWGCAEELARAWSMSAPELFDDGEFNKVARSFDPAGGIGFGTLVHLARQAGWTEPDGAEAERFTGSGGDVANGRLFAKRWRGKLLFVHETDEVLTFDEAAGWVQAAPGEADRAAKVVLAKLRDAAAEQWRTAPDDTKTKRLMAHVERTSKANNLRAMVEMAKSEEGMTCRTVDFDADPMLLGVRNGVVDLRSGELQTVAPELLVSKRCAVSFEPDAECPRFLQFLEDVQPDAELRGFIQRWAGYCLTGSVAEQKFAFLYGLGSNGKSVFVELLAWLLGDYSRKIPTELLMHHQRSPQGPSPDIVALKGLRLAYANETEEGRRLAEARVKDLTGGDTLTGRVPYGKADVTFFPTHKLVVVGNHRPEITDHSFGMWRRVALVPFDVTIPAERQDRHLLAKLKAEGAGILNWALDGLQAWARDGLSIPAAVEAATAAYRDEQDVLGEWMADHCKTGAGCTEQKVNLYAAYRSWAENNGHRPMAQGRLTRRLNERGFRLQPDRRTVAGLTLNERGRRHA